MVTVLTVLVQFRRLRNFQQPARNDIWLSVTEVTLADAARLILIGSSNNFEW